MCPQTIDQRSARRWKDVLAGAISAILLLPVAGYGAIANFNWGSWTYSSGGDPNPFATPDTSLTTSSQGVLNLTLLSSSGAMHNYDTWSITATFDVTGATGSTTSLGGAWTNLTNFQGVRGGQGGYIQVNVLQGGNGTSNNMFPGASYPTQPPPANGSPNAGLSTAAGLPVGSGYTVAVQFTFYQVGFMPNTSSPINLTLQQVP